MTNLLKRLHQTLTKSRRDQIDAAALADPFGERVDMDIAYQNDLHEVLYTRIRKGKTATSAHIWGAFLDRYPQFEHLRDAWTASRAKGVTPLNHGLPWMNFAAIEFLSNTLKPSSKVLEWGMGGSTVYWCARAGEIVSIEHDAAWFERAKDQLAHLNDRDPPLSLHLVEPQAKAPGDYPSGLAPYKDMSFEAYANAISAYPKGHFDLIVVDGRARMACLHGCVDYLAPGGTILLDNADYTRYQPELTRFWAAHQNEFERTDFLSPTPFSSNIGSQTSVFVAKSAPVNA